MNEGKTNRSTPKHLLLIDGECILCAGMTKFVVSRDLGDRFRFAALQSEVGRSMLKQVGGSPGRMDTFVYIREGRYYIKSSAALRVVRHLGKGWPLLSVLLAVPAPIRDAVYDFIAKRRNLWFGRQDVCLWRTPELRRKFVDELSEE
ncbi:hypothetical protein SY83_08775 [Paenibacillus swuensis]|uniref:Thiol-disulfide oxidoreductase DCC n=1 Tax=Paenibacillus swuensis TaxID=1178515 RepID=A0A172TPA2_9BACL|nr:hypothetical protein SY83_08775 [Paenibacillus swuensis]